MSHGIINLRKHALIDVEIIGLQNVSILVTLRLERGDDTAQRHDRRDHRPQEMEANRTETVERYKVYSDAICRLHRQTLINY